MPAAMQRIVQILLLGFIQNPKLLIHDQLGEPDDMVQGRPQLMAHVGQKLALRPAGRLCRLLGLQQFGILLLQFFPVLIQKTGNVGRNEGRRELMAAALEAGEVTPQTKYLESGPLEVETGTDEKQYIHTALNVYRGGQTMTNVLETSSNIGMAFVSKQLGRTLMYKYIKDFGFGI